MSKQPSRQKAGERDYFWENDIIDIIDLDDSLGHRILKWFKPMSFERLIKEGNRLMARAEKLNKQDEARRLARESRRKASESRSKLIPKNATIRREFVKCNKPNCRRRQPGPYYYAYWKDPKTKKVNKRYIGKDFFLTEGQKDA